MRSLLHLATRALVAVAPTYAPMAISPSCACVTGTGSKRNAQAFEDTER